METKPLSFLCVSLACSTNNVVHTNMLFLSTLIFILSFSFFFFTWWRRNKCTARRSLLLPPSPPRLPLLGNLHQLGSLPHRSLAALAESYGPLMLVHLGCVPTVVVSSAEVAREVMKDMIVGATDTISTSLEWAMAKIVKNPKAMKRALEEVREAAGDGAEKVSEEDLERTEYLKAVIKETLRMHPPLPLLIPRETTREVVLRGGYEIPAGTRVVVNAWAIGRDPRSWEEPEWFFPDRFHLGCSVDFRGHDFGLIPFGSRRRGCPGTELAAVTLEVTIAHLLHEFDWALPGGMKGELLDIVETPGLTVHKKLDLILIPISRNSG